ncbi:unnamed protein product [Arabidopsis lyrata]|nr:unnamed protein product [Arabidopsis lyrata]
MSSLSHCFPICSVPYHGLRPPPAPPPEPPSSPTPPEPPDPPDPQIWPSSEEALAQLLLLQHLSDPQRFPSVSNPPSPPPSRPAPPCQKVVSLSFAAVAPHRSSRRRHTPHPTLLKGEPRVSLFGPNVGGFVIGPWLLIGPKEEGLFIGSYNPNIQPTLVPLSSPFSQSLDTLRLKPSEFVKPRLVVSRFACSLSFSHTIPPIIFPQVRSFSPLSDSSNLRSYWMVVESVALALWNLITLDSFGSKLVLSRGTIIALVRTFTAVCRFYFNLAMLEASLWQIGKRSSLSFSVPVILVHRDFYSPHLSFMELIILPNTSLVLSGIVIGSIVVKTVLLGAEARIIIHDGSRSTFVGCLTLEALFPPPCGFGKDYCFEDVCFIGGPCLDSALVELLSSPLSLSLCLRFVVVLSLSSYSITLLVVVLDVWAPCSLVVFSVFGG